MTGFGQVYGMACLPQSKLLLHKCIISNMILTDIFPLWVQYNVLYRFVGTNVIIEYELFIVCSPSFGLRVYGLFQCMLWKTNLRGVGEVFGGCPNIVNWQNSSEKHNENHVKV